MCQLEGETVPTPPHRRTTTGAKTSPYFAKPIKRQQDNDTTKTKKKRRTASSRYFLRSPASVHGSIITLGPLIATWTSNQSGEQQIAKSVCCRPSSSTTICSACQPIIGNALQHWQECPQFCLPTSRTIMEIDLTSSSLLSCLEIIGNQAEKQVRHLCPHQCYLRAYSPYRDWWALRQAVLEKTDQSVDVLLQPWTCCLEDYSPEFNDDNNDLEVTTITNDSDSNPSSTIEDADEVPTLPSKKRPKVEGGLSSTSNSKSEIKPRQGTIFVNKLTGMRCTSILQVVRALSLAVETESTPNDGISRAFSPEKQSDLELGDAAAVMKPWNLEQSSPTNDTHSLALVSPLGLLEELFCRDPWQLLLSTILLNRTRRTQVDRVLYPFLQQWPTPDAILQMTSEEFRDMTLLIAPLGFHNRRARGIVQFTKDYVALVHQKENEKQEEHHDQSLTTMKGPDFRLTRTEILGLYHCGEYCADAYQIFIQQDWAKLHPADHALRAFVEWKQSQRTSA